MNVSELIAELEKHPMNAEVITPGNHFGSYASGIDEVVQVDDCILTDGSRYPVVMVRTD